MGCVAASTLRLSNISLDTEYATDEDCDHIFSQQGFISAFKDVKLLLYAVDNETCEPGVSTGPRGRRGCSPAAAAENGGLLYGPLTK